VTPQAARLSIDITSPELQTALLVELDDWDVPAHVTDRLDVGGPSTIRLVPCDSLPAQVAVAAVRNDEIKAAITFAEVDQIGAVVQTVGRGISCLTAGVIQNALTMSHLSDRQIAIVKLLALGRSNEFIAEEAHVSLSTLKRELRTLRRMTGCDDRISVIGRLGLGWEPAHCPDGAMCGRSMWPCLAQTAGHVRMLGNFESDHLGPALFDDRPTTPAARVPSKGETP